MVIDIFATLPTAEKPSQRKTTLRRTFESIWELDPFHCPHPGCGADFTRSGELK